MSQRPTEAPSRHILLCGCGPGELMGWALPLLDAAAGAGKPWRFSLLIWPRWFPSRRVAEVARGSGRFCSVLDQGAALRLLGGAGLPGAWEGRPPSLVLHLGGPPALSLWLGARWGRPVAAYSEWPAPWHRGFSPIFSVDPAACGPPVGGGAKDRCLPVGNLLVDAVAGLRAERAARLAGAAPGLTLGFFPGSRPLQLRHYLPRIPSVAQAVAKRVPGVHFLIARSPFVTNAMLAKALGGSGRILESAGEAVLLGEEGLRIPIAVREAVLVAADLLVCTPGTTTAEAAALGIPLLVVAPFDTDFRLFSGLAGGLERIPWLGSALKDLLLKRMAEGLGYYAYPNVRARGALVPELQGAVDLDRITEGIVSLLGDGVGRQVMAEQLLELMGLPGAADRMVAALDVSLS